MSIMERGGGIVSTVKATRECNFIQLRAKAEGFLKQMSTMGVTTVEGKSGYGRGQGNRVAATPCDAQSEQ